MQARPKYEFRTSQDLIEYLIFGIVFLIGFFYLLSVVFDKTYPQFIEVLFAFFIGFIGVYLIFAYIKKRSVFLYENYISFRLGFLLKRIEVRNDAILSWAEVTRSNKTEKWNELTIFTATKKYRFQSNHYNGYDLLKENITKDKPQDFDFEENQKASLNRKIGLFLIFLSFILLYFSLKSLINTTKFSDNTPIVLTEQIITSGLKIKRYKGSASIHLKFKDYSEFDFYIDAHAFAGNAADFVKEVNHGDTLTISLLKEDFEKKIAKTEPLSFGDKSFNYYTINLYSISHKGKSYLSLTDYDKFNQENKQSGFWTCLCLGLLLFLIGIYLRIQN
ncbi:hypothetical protein [Flavobacterium sp.]|uniref:hypothetical protein n=1 Tax=Flavobacterium sp. TaxID=239 RepID=UPI003919A0B9